MRIDGTTLGENSFFTIIEYFIVLCVKCQGTIPAFFASLAEIEGMRPNVLNCNLQHPQFHKHQVFDQICVLDLEVTKFKNFK